MRIAFMGTPDFAVPTLDALLSAGHDVAAVYCQPPRPAGRGRALSPSPVQRRAEEAGIAVRMPVSLKGADEQAAFAALDLDAAVVAAYGLILPGPILGAPRLGCLNVHASLLPRWRGAAPIQRAILAGDEQTGVTIMQMERGLDTGPMLEKLQVEVARKSAGELSAELAGIGAAVMIRVLEALRCGTVGRVPQCEEQATYAPKIDKGEARLDFTKTVVNVDRQVRAFNPAPGAFFEYEGERIKVLAVEGRYQEKLCVAGPPIKLARRVAPGVVVDDMLQISCFNGCVTPTLVQRAGRAVMTTAELLRGFPIPKGAKLQ